MVAGAVFSVAHVASHAFAQALRNPGVSQKPKPGHDCDCNFSANHPLSTLLLRECAASSHGNMRDWNHQRLKLATRIQVFGLLLVFQFSGMQFSWSNLQQPPIPNQPRETGSHTCTFLSRVSATHLSCLRTVACGMLEYTNEEQDEDASAQTKAETARQDSAWRLYLWHARLEILSWE